MEDRFRFGRNRVFLTTALLLGLSVMVGCQSGLATAMWLIKGPNMPAEYDCMDEKKVAVVCRAVDFSSFNYHNAPKELSRRVSMLLTQNGSKIEVIEQRKVDEWMDNNSWNEYIEVGRALDADIVLGIDLERFSIYEGQTLYQGKANVTIKTYDCESGELLVDKPLPQSVYPPNSAKPTSDLQESEFCREYLAVLADEIGRHFYPHDPRANFAADAAAMQQQH